MTNPTKPPLLSFSALRLSLRPSLRLSLLVLAPLTLCACAKAGESNPPATINPELNGGASGGNTGGGGAGVEMRRAEGRPSLARIGDKVAEVGRELRIVLNATDPQNDVLQFNLRTEVPEGAHFDKPSATFTWTPVPSQANTHKLLTFEVSDGSDKDQETIRVDISGMGESVQLPPVVDDMSDQSLRVDVPWSLQVEASDPNSDPLTYQLLNEPLEGLSLNDRTGLMSWTPSAAQVGSHSVTIRVSDGVLNTDKALRLVVSAQDTPQIDPPQFVAQGPIEVELGQQVSFQVQVNYSSAEPPIVTLDQGPEGAQFNPSTLTFTWTPTVAQAYTVIFSANSGDFTIYMPVDIIVSEPPPPEVVCPTDPDPVGSIVSLDETGDLLDGRVLCETGESDEYSLVLEEGGELDLLITFSRPLDLDLYLLDSVGNTLASSYATDSTEERILYSALAGLYTVRVNLWSGQAALYDLSLEVTQSPVLTDCATDRLEPNDSAANASVVRRNLYGDLSACQDADWYRASADPGYPLVVYIASNDPNAVLTAQTPSGVNVAVDEEVLASTVDGCLSSGGVTRAYCKRFELDTSASSTLAFSPRVRAGERYDMRVRFGDEVSAPCDTESSVSCNPNFDCAEGFNGLIFFDGSCTKPCSASSQCEGSNRACVTYNGSTNNGLCLQRCTDNYDCRAGFECILSNTTEGSAKVCHGL